MLCFAIARDVFIMHDARGRRKKRFARLPSRGVMAGEFSEGGLQQLNAMKKGTERCLS